MKSGQMPPDLDSRRRAMLELAERLTRAPETMKVADYDALRSHGFADEDLYDLVFMVSCTNHMDRVADGLNAIVGDGEDWCRGLAEASRGKTAGGS